VARKVCPSCKKLNAGSATTCACGHEFATSSIVLPKEPKVCPACGRGNAQTARQCRCGLDFTLPPDELRETLQAQVVNGWILAAIGPFGIAAGVGGILVGFVRTGFLLCATSIASALKGLRMRSLARAGQRELAAAHPPLPVAVVVRDRNDT
jgi:hypothetical protein